GDRVGALDEFGLDRHLERRQTECLTRCFFIDATHLEHHAARSHHANPVIDRPFTFTHPRFGGLGGYWLIGGDANPHAAPALGIAYNRLTGGFDLALRDPCWL